MLELYNIITHSYRQQPGTVILDLLRPDNLILSILSNVTLPKTNHHYLITFILVADGQKFSILDYEQTVAHNIPRSYSKFISESPLCCCGSIENA